MTTRYFVLEPAELGPQGLLRLTIDGQGLNLEHFDRKAKVWVDSPEAIDFLNGSDADAREIPQDQAAKLVKGWGGNAA